MAAARQSATYVSQSIIKTRRMNQTESFRLEERLKALENKKSQKNAEFTTERFSLQQRMSEIKRVRNKVGISVERRKLLRSQGFTIDTRVANGYDNEAVVIKRHSMPDMITASSPSTESISPKVLHLHLSEPTIGSFVQMAVQGEGEMEKDPSEELQNEPSSGFARSRVRHQFRIIEPPSRPGSRRNFVQLSNDKLKEFKDSEEESGKELFDPNLKLDHRGKILPANLAKSIRKESWAENERPPSARLYRARSRTCSSISDREPHIYHNASERKEQEKGLDSLTSTEIKSRDIPPGLNKQAWVETKELDGEIAAKKYSSSTSTYGRELKSKSCENLGSLGSLDGSLDCQDSLSKDKIVVRHADHADKTSKGTRNVQSSLELSRKQAVSGNLTKLAFVESDKKPPGADIDIVHKQRTSVGYSIHQTHQRPRLGKQDAHNTEVGFARSSGTSTPSDPTRSSTSPHAANATAKGLDKRVEAVRRVTLPGRFASAQAAHQSAQHPEENNNKIAHEKNARIGAKLSLPQSPTPNMRRSKKEMVSLKPETKSKDAVLAYDARPSRAICKGYVTMQMTVNGKQVKVHIPRFPNDSNEPSIDRIRAKASADRLQPRLLSGKVDKGQGD